MCDYFNDEDRCLAPRGEGDVIKMVDEAVMREFIVKDTQEADKANPYYQSMRDMLAGQHDVPILYERLVITVNHVLPRYFYLFGFKHKASICPSENGSCHALIPRDANGDDLDPECSLINGLHFILQAVDDSKVWCHVPLCQHDTTPQCERLKPANAKWAGVWPRNVAW